MSLRDEVHANPACASALAARDCEALAAIMSSGRTAIKPISAAKALTWAAAGPMAAIVDASNEVGNAARSSAQSFLRSLASGMEVGLDNADVLAAFQGWKALALITAAEYDSLMAMALVAAPVTAQDIAAAVYNADGSEK